jgi:hypothetical protein
MRVLACGPDTPSRYTLTHTPPPPLVVAHAQRSVDMDGKSFIKLCKDTKLVGKGLTSTDIDLIFAKVGVLARCVRELDVCV